MGGGEVGEGGGGGGGGGWGGRCLVTLFADVIGLGKMSNLIENKQRKMEPKALNCSRILCDKKPA